MEPLNSTQNHSGQAPEKWVARLPILEGVPELSVTSEIFVPTYSIPDNFLKELVSLVHKSLTSLPCVTVA